jgi:RsiW-degrading membrane proteinase PrsW (M82 family)
MSILSLLAQADTSSTGCNPGQAGVNLSDCFVTQPGGPTVAATYNNPAALVDILVNNLFPLAGILFLFIILFAGFKFIYQGTKGKDEAKQIIETAIIGFVVMFSAYWVLQIVRVVTGIDTLGI